MGKRKVVEGACGARHGRCLMLVTMSWSLRHTLEACVSVSCSRRFDAGTGSEVAQKTLHLWENRRTQGINLKEAYALPCPRDSLEVISLNQEHRPRTTRRLAEFAFRTVGPRHQQLP